jgi:hypothetical protein
LYVKRRIIVTCLALVALFLAPREGLVRTWYVTADSTGDAPFIRAALDSVATGDTILVAPGTYVFTACRWIQKGIVIMSEAGPLETKILSGGPPIHYPGCAFNIDTVDTGVTVIDGFWFDGFEYMHLGAGVINIEKSDSVYILNNVFTNHVEAAIMLGPDFPSSFINIENNTFVSGEYSIVNLIGFTHGFVRYNIIWSPADGLANFSMDICNCIINAYEPDPYNFEADPEFCGTIESYNLFLQSDSPCAPGNSPLPTFACDSLRVIGALTVGCGTTPTRSSSWGAIKTIYKR